MSLIWLEPFIDMNFDSSFLEFDNLNAMIYLNCLSIVSFVLFALLYRYDKYIQKQKTNDLVLMKMLSECLVSFHLLLLFLCFQYENDNITNKKSLDSFSKVISFETSTLMFLISLMSPLFLFMTYYFNLCIAKNIANAFVDSKDDYHKRVQFYKLFAFITCMILFFIAIILNSRSVNKPSFTANYYPSYYIGIFYFLLMCLMIYVGRKLWLILKHRRQQMQSTINFCKDPTEQRAINSFTRQHTLFVVFFIVCYLPNNVIQFTSVFMENKILTKGLKDESWIYSLFILLLSSSCTITFIIKLTDPYVRRYIGVAFSIMTLKKSQEEVIKDLEKPLFLGDEFSTKNGDDERSVSEMVERRSQQIDEEQMDKLVSTWSNLNKNLTITDHLVRLIALSTMIQDERNLYLSYCKSESLPWNDGRTELSSLYSQKSDFANYNKDNFPVFLKINKDSDFYHYQFKVRSYCPVIFSHIRTLDKIDSLGLLHSLDYSINSSHLSKAFASGGRSANPILYTHDKKYLIKTISKEEKNLLLSILPKFHQKMGDAYSLLCRIYGVYRIKILNKIDTHIVIMKNMCELPEEVTY